MDSPRFARLDEFAEVMHFIDRVFRPGQRGRRIVQGQYPHLYQPDEQHMRRHLILRDEGKIVGQLAIHPLQLRVGTLRLKAGGIGTVATDPERRGEGIMGVLLRRAVEEMERRRYDLSILGGDRQRYGWFGWENAGIRTVYTLSARSVGSTTARDCDISLLRNPELSEDILGRILRIHSGTSRSTVRPRALVADILNRTSRDVWIAEQGQRWAYLVLGGARHQARPYERVDEIGGDGTLVQQALQRIMDRYRLSGLRAVAGVDSYAHGVFTPISEGWHSESDGMAKILDVPSLLEKIYPVMAELARQRGVRGTYNFCDTRGRAWGGWKLQRGGVYRLKLGERELVRLLFGHLPNVFSFGHIEGAEGLAQLLPLPLHVPPLEHI